MNKERSPGRAVSPMDGPTKESPRAANQAPGSPPSRGGPAETRTAAAETPASAAKAGSNAVLRRHAVIRNQRGLHARAAAKFVKLVGQFDADIRVSRAGQTVSGHSIMGLMMLAAR